MRRSKSEMLQAECNRFMQNHTVGDTIRVWTSIAFDGPGDLVTIVAPGAYVLGGHTAVVQVTGGHGCIALSHVERKARR